jgi:hypothetical protein
LWNVAFSATGEALLTWTQDDRSARLWRTPGGERLAELVDDGLPIRSAKFSADGGWCVTLAGDSSVSVWNAANGERRAVLRGREPSLAGVWPGPQAERLFTSSTDGLLRLWNGRTGESIGLIGNSRQRFSMATFAAEGALLLTQNERRDEVRVWDSQRGERRIVLQNRGGIFSDAILSSDGRWLATVADDGALRFWPTRPAPLIERLELREFSPDERELFQIGTEEQRAALRESWNEGNLAKSLLSLPREFSSFNDARSVRLVVQRLLRESIDSLGPAVTRSQVLAHYEGALRALGEKYRTPSPILSAFASAFAEAGDFHNAERLAIAALDSCDFCDQSDWRFWLSCALRPSMRSPGELLAAFPESTSADASDARWLLETLAAGEPIRIHAGGDAMTAADGTVWRQDCFFGGGHLFGEAFGSLQPSSEPIHGTRDPLLYQTERWFDREREAVERSYLIPLPPGQYRIVLHFAEIYFQPPDRRVFDVLAEDRLVIDNYDTLAKGFATADSQSFETRVDDGLLNLEFRSVIENPKVSGIEIVRSGD